MALGAAGLDLTLPVPLIAPLEGTVEGGPRRETLGGRAAVVAATVRRLGGRSALVARVGADPDSDRVLERLERDGVDVSAVARVPGGRVERSFVLVDEDGARRVCTRPARLDGRHLRVPGRAAIYYVEEPVPRLGGTIVAEGLAPFADLAIVSRERAEEIAGRVDYERALIELRRRGARTALVTLDESGCGWIDADGETHWLDAFRVRVPGGGCGGVFRGALVFGLARAWPMESATEFASAVAAMYCVRREVPAPDAVARFLRSRRREASYLDGLPAPPPRRRTTSYWAEHLPRAVGRGSGPPVLFVGQAGLDYALEARVGGTAAVAAIECARRGGRAILWTRLGLDPEGWRAAREFASAGVEVHGPRSASTRTAVVVGGTAYVDPGSDEGELEDDWLALAEEAGAVVFDEGWETGALAAILRVRAGTPVVAAIERPSPAIDDLVAQATVVVMPDYGVRFMARGRREVDVLRGLCEDGPRAAIMVGRQGSLLVDRRGSVRLRGGELGIFAGTLAWSLARGADVRLTRTDASRTRTSRTRR